MNSLIIKGNISTDIKLFNTANTTVANFSVAVNRPFTKDKTDFFKVVAFGTTAEFISRWFSKGQPILLQSHIINDEYTDSEGKKRIITKVVVDQAEFAGYPKNASSTPKSQTDKPSDDVITF